MYRTISAYRDEKWEPFSSLRLILEGKSVTDYCLTSAERTLTDRVSRLIDLVALVREHGQAVVEAAERGSSGAIAEDLRRLAGMAEQVRDWFRQEARAVEDLGEHVRRNGQGR